MWQFVDVSYVYACKYTSSGVVTGASVWETRLPSVGKQIPQTQQSYA